MLGSELGSPHSCRCGSWVDVSGTHGFVCKHAPMQSSGEASRPKRVCQLRLQCSRHSSKEEANWSGSQGRTTPGRLHPHSLARR